MECICYYKAKELIHTVKNKVRLARVEMDYTQLQLAEKIGVTRQTISLIEKGKYNPTLKLCLKLCYAMDKKLDDVFWMDKEEFDHEED